MQLFERHSRALYNYAAHLTHDDEEARDLMHDALVRILQRGEQYDFNRSFIPYAKKVIYHLYITERLPRRNREVLLSAFSESFPFPTRSSEERVVSTDILTERELEAVRKNSVSQALTQRIRLRYDRQWTPITDSLRARGGYYDLVYVPLSELLAAVPNEKACPLTDLATEIRRLLAGQSVGIVRGLVLEGQVILMDSPLVCALKLLLQRRLPIMGVQTHRVPCVFFVATAQSASDDAKSEGNSETPAP